MLNIGVIYVPPASTLVLHPEPTLQSPVCKPHTSVSIDVIDVIAVDQGNADVFTTSIVDVKKTRLHGVNRVLLIHQQKPTALTSSPRQRGKITNSSDQDRSRAFRWKLCSVKCVMNVLTHETR
jgi:hypothetical protein